MLLHAAKLGYNASPLPKAMYLCLRIDSKIPCPMYIKCERQTRIRLLDIVKLCQS